MIQNRLAKLAAVRQHTLTMVEDLTQEQMDFLPAPDDWSVGEIVGHLTLSEGLIRDGIAKLIHLALAGKTPYLYQSFADFNVRIAYLPNCALQLLEFPLALTTTFLPDTIREYALRNVPIPAQAPENSVSERGLPKAERLADLNVSLRETEALFEPHPDLNYEQMRAQHPLFGIQTVPQLVRSIYTHEEAHQDQIRRVMNDPRFPAPAFL
jgi:hypothetical protein